MNRKCLGDIFTVNGLPGYRCFGDGTLLPGEWKDGCICPQCNREICVSSNTGKAKTRTVNQIKVGSYVWEEIPKQLDKQTDMSITCQDTDCTLPIGADQSEVQVATSWHPRWIIDIERGSTLGIAIDDGCFVVLYPQGNKWKPGKHIPKAVAARMAELLEFAADD